MSRREEYETVSYTHLRAHETGSYIMEISSPGLDRPLKKDKDFERNMGKLVEIRTYRPIEKQKEFCGILTAYDSNSVTIDEDGTERVFDKKDTALIRLAIEF